jgi:uncharacterized protein (DUF924 family)
MTLPADVLGFWFGAPGSPQAAGSRKEWFVKDDAFDREIVERFGDLIDAALAGQLDGWSAQPASALARILVLDQFTRNAFRGTARAFAGDAQALAAARAMVAAGDDQALPPLQRSFVYMPFEHAEDLAMQNEAARLFAQLGASTAGFAEMLDYAHRHRAVITRFGRFPHRNAVLGRESTADELAFLAQPGSRF